MRLLAAEVSYPMDGENPRAGRKTAMKKPAPFGAGSRWGRTTAGYEPFEQTKSDEFPWKLYQPFTDVLVGAPK